jgi:hypothetical protein
MKGTSTDAGNDTSLPSDSSEADVSTSVPFDSSAADVGASLLPDALEVGYGEVGCTRADGRDWFECCLATPPETGECAPRLSPSEAPLVCTTESTECFSAMAGSWLCRRPEQEVLVTITPSGLMQSDYPQGGWHRSCMSCDGTFTGIGAFDGVNYLNVGKLALTPDANTMSMMFTWCAASSRDTCRASPEGWAEWTCQRTDEAAP